MKTVEAISKLESLFLKTNQVTPKVNYLKILKDYLDITEGTVSFTGMGVGNPEHNKAIILHFTTSKRNADLVRKLNSSNFAYSPGILLSVNEISYDSWNAFCKVTIEHERPKKQKKQKRAKKANIFTMDELLNL